MRTNKYNAGFTLVELAIVLVIIGLLVGGVLVGSDMIKAATIQKTTRQVSDIEVGATTFRAKYNQLPGDLQNASTVITLADGTTGPWTGGSRNPGAGNGDGIIQATADGTAATATLGAAGETINFMPHLAAAGYIKDNLVGQAYTVYTASVANIQAALPPAAIGQNTYLIASGATGGTGINATKNYLLLVGAPSAVAAAGIPPWTATLTPLQASNIDVKLDDGVPSTGNVISVAAAAPSPGTAGNATAAAGTYAAGQCYDTDTNAYWSAQGDGTCNLSIRASF